MKLSSLIELQNINKSYTLADHNLPVLNNINLQIRLGECIAIMGTSGSGKSTLMNIIGLLDHPDNGNYLLKSKRLENFNHNELASLRNETFGFVFQSFFLLPRFTAIQNIALPLRYGKHHHINESQRIQELLQRVGMAEYADHKPNQLSGGQQQRVAIARALVCHPKILLADEPTGALDSKTGQEILDLFFELNAKEGTTIVIVTHDAHVAEQCQRTIIIKDGQMQCEET